MIICSNCGATNNEAETHICRKCGALLPISSKPPRIRLTTPKKSTGKSKPKKVILQEEETISNKLNLQEIPKGVIQTDNELKSEPLNDANFKLDQKDIDNEYDEYKEEKEILQEIAPKPFRGSIISSKSVNQSSIKQSKKAELTTKDSSVEISLLKQKQLEEDMSKVLKFLSNKITVKKLPSEEKKEIKKKTEPTISPASLSEILKELLKLDLHIEASAIIKNDGTILASAISSRISDSLFATIGQNLLMIGKDIIEGLTAGKLMNISVRGTNGVLDLAPIDIESTLGKDMLLIILSNPRVKSGIINFAANIVRKQVKEYLGISK
ncbi:MAG: roadblock/LC7 domain-containing protein [Promethearchaeota archaeon]